MDVVDIKIQEYEERITFLEKKVSDLEKSNLLLDKMLDENINFSSKVSKIVFKMDCLLAQKNDEIRKLEQEMKNMTESLAVIPSDFTMDIFNDDSSQIEVIESLKQEESQFEPDIKMEPVYDPEPEIKSNANNLIENIPVSVQDVKKNSVRSHMIVLEYEKIAPKRNADGMFVCTIEISRLNSKLPFYDGKCPYQTAVKPGFLDIVHLVRESEFDSI